MIKKKLNYLMKDEKKAPKDYRRLIPLLETKTEKNSIRKIIREEKNHSKILNKLQRKYK